MKTNLALIGMSGTFKSTVAKKLAPLIHKYSLDCDELIEFELGLKLKDVFEKAGEEYFRQIEKKQILDIADFTNTVIATGGGAVLDEDNMRVLKSCALVVCLDADAKNIFNRLKKDTTRPLLFPVTEEKINAYVENRRHLYPRWADFKVNTNGKTADTVTKLILEWYNKQIT